MSFRSRRVVRNLLAAFVPAAAVAAARSVNARRSGTPSPPDDFDPQDPEGYDLDRPGLSITLIRHGDVVGFHALPDRLSRPGVVVTFGGSEGSPDLETAVAIAQDGCEVFAMFFFGQDDQEEELVDVPLERASFFAGTDPALDAALAYLASHSAKGASSR